MRNEACRCWVELFKARPFVFLTGDLGFKALEPLRDAMGKRFINAGVAEQNMVSVAAGLARRGLDAWVYSIAPFCYARPFEQIRNDVCLHGLPVVLVGNGGGYGYGVMGATHHALEDYGAMLLLPNLRAYVPAFRSDVARIVQLLARTDSPAYLRLGTAEEAAGTVRPEYAAWRRVLEGRGATLIVVGPLAGGILEAAAKLAPEVRPSTWVLSELPIAGLPDALLEDLRASEHLAIVEEHVAHGGVGEAIARELLSHGRAPRRFTHLCARGYVSGKYGSQKFHRRECGLDPESVLRSIGAMERR